MTDIAGPLAFTVDEVEKVILERHKKYGPKNIANSPGGPLNGLSVRLFDKLARLNNYIDGGAEADFSDDSLRDCFIDIAGYGLIGLLVLDGNWPGVKRPEAEALSTEGFAFAQRDEPDTTHLWSRLAKSDESLGDGELDSWPVGTTFKATDSWSEYTFERGPEGWRCCDETGGGHWPSLALLIDFNGYTDGVITEPTKPGGGLFPPPGEPGHVMFCLPGGPCGCQPRPPSPLSRLAEGVTIPSDNGTVSIPIIQPVKYEPPF